jgi:hypothetical protein
MWVGVKIGYQKRIGWLILNIDEIGGCPRSWISTKNHGNHDPIHQNWGSYGKLFGPYFTCFWDVFGMFLGPLTKKILSKSKEVYGKSPPLAQPLLPFWRMVVSRPGEMIAMVEIVPWRTWRWRSILGLQKRKEMERIPIPKGIVANCTTLAT